MYGRNNGSSYTTSFHLGTSVSDSEPHSPFTNTFISTSWGFLDRDPAGASVIVWVKPVQFRRGESISIFKTSFGTNYLNGSHFLRLNFLLIAWELSSVQARKTYFHSPSTKNQVDKKQFHPVILYNHQESGKLEVLHNKIFHIVYLLVFTLTSLHPSKAIHHVLVPLQGGQRSGSATVQHSSR